MLKKRIKYEDFDGNTVEEDFYFNLTKAELVELELVHKGGLADYMKQIVAADNAQEIIDIFKKIILMSVGRRSDDGKRFIKTDEIRNEFSQTNAYSELFLEMATNAGSAVDFINGVVPAGLAQDVNQMSLPIGDTPKLPESVIPQDAPAETKSVFEKPIRDDTPPKPEEYTPEQLGSMDREQLLEHMQKQDAWNRFWASRPQQVQSAE